MGLGNRKSLPLWKSKYILWIILMLPGGLTIQGILTGSLMYSDLMHVSGELSGKFLTFSLIATPLAMLLPNAKFPKWLIRNKRYFGVAAFIYAFYHVLVYLIKTSVSQIMNEWFQFSFLTAWISFIIWIPMAITSTDSWVLRLKSSWKKIHNWGYLAALLAFLHWSLIHYHWQPMLLHAAPVILLQSYRWIVHR